MRKLFLLFAFLMAGPALAQTLPPLNFDSPPGFRGGGEEVATFTAPEGDLVIHVYPFRRLGPGNFQARFHETLLREFIVPSLREGKHATAPQIEPFSVEGAEAAVSGKFREDGRERVRYAMLASGAVALVDVTANSAAAVQQHADALKALLDSISVGQPKARAAPPPVIAAPEVAAVVATAPAVAPAVAPAAAPKAPEAAFSPGVYVGNVRRLIPSFVGGKEAGGMWVTGPQYFVLSGEGLAYRNYEQPRIPGGDLSRFDWKRAQSSDASNTGTYELLGNELTLRVGTETISAKLAGPGRFEIFGTQFSRTTLK